MLGQAAADRFDLREDVLTFERRDTRSVAPLGRSVEERRTLGARLVCVVERVVVEGVDRRGRPAEALGLFECAVADPALNRERLGERLAPGDRQPRGAQAAPTPSAPSCPGRAVDDAEHGRARRRTR